MTLADRLRALLAEQGHSIAAVAEMAGLERQQVWRVVSGLTKDPKWSTVERIVEAAGGTIPDLYAEDDWIACTDRLPELGPDEVEGWHYSDVVVICPKGDDPYRVTTACLHQSPDGQRYWAIGEYDELKPEDVTHWRPMPAPPESD